jgi:hypothetical protein
MIVRFAILLAKYYATCTMAVMEETNDNGRASSLAVTLAGLGVAVVFEALTVLATHDKAVRAVSPWQDDPYDVALSHSQFAVPMLAAVIALRLLAWRAPGGQDRAWQVVRATGMMTALIGLTLVFEWAAVAVGAHAPAWGPWTSVLIGGLAVTSLLAGAEAVLLARGRRPRGAAGRWRHDWLDDIITVCGRVPALRRAAPRAAAWLRCHAAAGFAALSVLVAVVIAGGLAVSEAWTSPLLVAWALIVEITGYFAFFMICNAVAGFVARPPRGRSRRVAEASAVAGGAAVQVAVAFRAELWTVIGAGSAKSVPAVVALTLGAGLATSLATAGLLALRRLPVLR